MLRRHCGVDDDLSMYRALGLDKIVFAGPVYLGTEKEKADLGSDPEERTLNHWGVPMKTVQAGAARYTEFFDPPLADCETPAALDSYPLWPKPERFDYAGAEGAARAVAGEFAVIGPWVSLFEIYCKLRGLEQALIDVLENEEFLEAALDRIEEIQTGMMERYFARAGRLLDLVFISEDIAGQQSLLMAPDAWERHLRPRLKRWCDLVHAHGYQVFYHTDGAARPLLRPILDCGVDVLNPIQHACPGMDMMELKREFGHRVIFHGGVENQSVLPHGTPEQVRAEVRQCLDTLGAGREGFICCSCHNVQAGTPVENVLAMIEAVRES